MGGTYTCARAKRREFLTPSQRADDGRLHMTLVVGVLANDFALIAADKRAGLGNHATVQLANGATVTLKSDSGIFFDAFSKVYIADDGEGAVGIAGTVQAHLPHLESGKHLSGFARDAHIHAELGKLATYEDLVNVTAPIELTVEQCLHMFRHGDRFYGTVFNACMINFSRHTQRGGPSELRCFAIGSGAPAFNASLLIPTAAAEWAALNARAANVAPDDVRKFVRKVFKVAAATVPDVGDEIDVYVLQKQGPWIKAPSAPTPKAA